MFIIFSISIAITLLATIIAYLYSRHKFVWWEYIVMIFSGVLTGYLSWVITTNVVSLDTEFLTTTKVETRYYEDWNEYIYQTCTTTNCDGDGNCTVTTYDCSYVDYHPEQYTIVDDLGNELKINKIEYNRLKRKYGNSSFVDMKRDYHTNDGDMYKSVWNGSLEKYEAVTVPHRYKNKVMYSHTVYDFINVTQDNIQQYSLFDYPKVDNNYFQKSVLGYTAEDTNQVNHAMEILNGTLGVKKQVKAFILIFKNQPPTAYDYQKAYWFGGNKNEFVVCVGVDDGNRVQWGRTFSWTEGATIDTDIRYYLSKDKQLNLLELISILGNDLDNHFVRRELAEFDYLEVELTTNQIMLITFIMCIVVGLLYLLFIKNNRNHH